MGAEAETAQLKYVFLFPTWNKKHDHTIHTFGFQQEALALAISDSIALLILVSE